MFVPFIIIVVIISLIVAAYFLLKDKIFGKSDSKGDKPNTPAGSSQVINSGTDEFPLKVGSKGLKVKQLQAGLNLKNNAKLDVDGKFGSKTQSALKKYYGITSLSQYDYDKYVYPYLSEINVEINKSSSFSGEAVKGKKAYSVSKDTHIFPAGKIFGVGDFLHIGEIKGYAVDSSAPEPAGMEGDLLGDVLCTQGEYYLVKRSDGVPVFVLQSETNIL